MDRELLIEIGVEELPASWMPGLTVQLAERLEARLKEYRIAPGASVESFGTPRRLTARVARIAERQEDLNETVTGPPVSAAFGADGQPTPAALGFAKKQGVPFDQLTRAQTAKGEYLAYQKRQRGRSAVDTLPDIVGGLLRDLTFRKQMHWDAKLDDGRGELLFGRPIRWLLFLYGGRVVPFTIGRSSEASSPQVQDIESGAVTYGHRFLATSGRAGRSIKVRSFDEYQAKLAEHFVVLDHADRRDRIARDLEIHARRLGGRVQLKDHAALLEEVADLVEYPAVVAGFFDPRFLVLPEEVLSTTLVHHQHYFPVVTDRGALKEAFLAVVNTQPTDERLIAKNAERVVAARLRDAKFFWESDRKSTLESRLDRLHTVLFHKKLGSYRDKAQRIEKLADWIAREALGRPDVAEHAARAGRLAKADLTTDMVFEFPELQGTMGGIYAREEGQPEEVWKAISYHYLPIGLEADAPPSKTQLGRAAITWAAVSLADKADTLAGLVTVGERSTGSRDPYGLRRQAHGLIKVMMDLPELVGLNVPLTVWEVVTKARAPFASLEPQEQSERTALGLTFVKFIWERIQFALQQRGFSIQEVRAIMLRYDEDSIVGIKQLSPLDCLRRLKALQEMRTSTEFTALAILFKRAKNIARELPEEEFIFAESTHEPLALKLPAEKVFQDELSKATTEVNKSVARHDYGAALRRLADLRSHVDRFFVEVLVMADEPALRTSRLRLMRRLRNLVLSVADLSEIVPQTE